MSKMDSYLDPPLPPPYQRRGDRTFQKLSHLGGGGGVPKFLLERGDNPGMGVDVEIGGCHFFITLQFNSIQIYCMCLGKVKFLLLYFDSLVF